ncbi:hypothetical protein SAMN05444358_11615 [Ruegeria halocynthiae]|uniref:Uncharacterized protein n=1 Tax=Ruegeria halocynthiae TaxID=985054 RepID=A0A1H3FL81_9RHOB|nr:hypothetical protein SAMN05444358_11615 [Ruegeria halocynthiae]
MWSLGSLQQLKVLAQGELTVRFHAETSKIINLSDFYKTLTDVPHLAA